jgi:hypothetical protein
MKQSKKPLSARGETRRSFLKKAAGVAAATATFSGASTAVSATKPESGGGVVSGRARLEGRPPPEIPVDLSNFPLVQKVAPPGLTTHHYIVSPDGGLANVFVYVLHGLEGRTFPIPDEQPILDQHNAGFHPYVMGLQVGQIFRIRNSEPYLETVKATPKVNEGFLIYQPITGMVELKRFTKPEVLVKIKCELHPWEFAYIGVVPHPFFAVTDTEGRYRLPPGLPAGRYTIAGVHPKAGVRTAEIELAENGAATADFTFHPHKRRRLPPPGTPGTPPPAPIPFAPKQQ